MKFVPLSQRRDNSLHDMKNTWLGYGYDYGLIQLKTLYPVLSSVTILSLPQQIRLLLMGTTSKIESINRMITISYKQYKNYKVVDDLVGLGL